MVNRAVASVLKRESLLDRNFQLQRKAGYLGSL
jgi:hypothetical protein